MTRYRISSLATLLGLIAVIALGLTGMASASSLWTAAAATITLASLLGAVLAACLLPGSERAFWAGFALFGWVYLVLVNWDWVGGQFGHDLTAGLSEVAEALFPEVSGTPPPLITPTGILPSRPLRVPPPPAGNPAQMNPTPFSSMPSSSVAGFNYFEMVQKRQIRIGNFVQISRMSLSFLFALLGGIAARTIVERRDARARSPGAASPG
jgi:hypothetical protein